MYRSFLTCKDNSLNVGIIIIIINNSNNLQHQRCWRLFLSIKPLDSNFVRRSQSNNFFGVMCKGCGEKCDGCYFERSSETPVCAETMENSYSPGGLTTLDLVSINPGYWRATAFSEEVLACYNADACLGGLTGAPDFCLDGYEGPCKRVELIVSFSYYQCTRSV